MEEEDGIPYVYTGCEVDHQGNEGSCYFVKLNGLTGELVWEDTIPCRKLHFGDNTSDGGMYVTPLIGGGDCEGLIFSAFCLHTAQTSGVFMAFDKKELLKIAKAMNIRVTSAWKKSELAEIAANEVLRPTVFRKQLMATAKIGSNFEASPIIVDNKIIIGSRGNKIYKISLQ